MNAKEFEILGNKVKLTQSADEKVDPEYAVKLVRQEALNIKESAPNLSNERLFLLAALKLAADKLTLEEDIRKDVGQLQASAIDALHLIEEASPANL